MRNRTKVIAGTGVVALAGLGIGLGLAWPLTSSGFSGTETFTGVEHLTTAQANANSYIPVIPLAAAGAFKDTGSIKLINGSGPNGNGPGPATIALAKGDLVIRHGATPDANRPAAQVPGTCRFEVHATTTYTITGGTGAYTGATGSGAAKVVFSFIAPTMVTPGHTGGLLCNVSNSSQPIPGSAMVTFHATGPVTVP